LSLPLAQSLGDATLPASVKNLALGGFGDDLPCLGVVNGNPFFVPWLFRCDWMRPFDSAEKPPCFENCK
jgi:hypothetical protein